MKEQMKTSKPAGAEPVAEVVWLEADDHGTWPKKNGRKDVDYSQAWIDSVPLGTKLYAHPPAAMPEKPYRGDPPRPTRLTTKESSRKASIATLRANIEKLQSNLNVHIAACDHAAFVDEPGFPYDSRMCAVCDAHIAFI